MNIADQVALVGPRIREIRTQQRMTLAHLSRTTAISESTLSRLETGARKPTLEAAAIANDLGIPLDETISPPLPALHRLTRERSKCFPQAHTRRRCLAPDGRVSGARYAAPHAIRDQVSARKVAEVAGSHGERVHLRAPKRFSAAN